jgi:hypothetical protein
VSDIDQTAPLEPGGILEPANPGAEEGVFA